MTMVARRWMCWFVPAWVMEVPSATAKELFRYPDAAKVVAAAQGLDVDGVWRRATPPSGTAMFVATVAAVLAFLPVALLLSLFAISRALMPGSGLSAFVVPVLVAAAFALALWFAVSFVARQQRAWRVETCSLAQQVAVSFTAQVDGDVLLAAAEEASTVREFEWAAKKLRRDRYDDLCNSGASMEARMAALSMRKG